MEGAELQCGTETACVAISGGRDVWLVPLLKGHARSIKMQGSKRGRQSHSWFVVFFFLFLSVLLLQVQAA